MSVWSSRARTPERGLARRLEDPAALLLDGALGTQLEAASLRCDPPLWSARALLESPDSVAAIHRSYATAGVEVHTANTFRTRRSTLARIPEFERHAARLAGVLTARAVSIARVARATERSAPLLVLGSLGPVADCYRPDLAPDDDSLECDHRDHAEHLAAAGCDGILVETQNSVREGRIATAAAAATGLPVWSSFVCGPDARLLSGEPLSEALVAAAAAGASAIGVNCASLQACNAALPVLTASGLPFGLAPNLAFDPSDRMASDPSEDEAPATPRDTESFRAAALRWRDAGARYLGACCGSRPEDLDALARALRDKPKRAAR